MSPKFLNLPSATGVSRTKLIIIIISRTYSRLPIVSRTYSRVPMISGTYSGYQ